MSSHAGVEESGWTGSVIGPCFLMDTHSSWMKTYLNLGVVSPSVARTAGSGCCFATYVVFLDVLASIRSRGWPTSIGDSRPHSYPCVPPLPPQIISRGARFYLGCFWTVFLSTI